jgi:hypothetical protein
MASSTTIPPAAPDPFGLGIHTPANLNRGARAALLQNSPVAVNGTIRVSPGPRRVAQTPSSPLNAATIAAATEGAARANPSLVVEQLLNRCWGFTCKQGYFKITAEMVKPLRGRF